MKLIQRVHDLHLHGPVEDHVVSVQIAMVATGASELAGVEAVRVVPEGFHDEGWQLVALERLRQAEGLLSVIRSVWIGLEDCEGHLDRDYRFFTGDLDLAFVEP